MSSNRPQGRIHPGQRNPDNVSKIHHISIRPEHAEGIAVTVDQTKKTKTRNDRRNRLTRSAYIITRTRKIYLSAM